MSAPARLGGAPGLGRAVRALAVRLAQTIARAAVGARWYATTLMGDHDYARYVEHLARTHPEQEPESERAYWRSRHDDSTPQARCC